MSRRICREIDDHAWVSDGPGGETYCMDCSLRLEDALEAHSMMDLDEEDE